MHLMPVEDKISLVNVQRGSHGSDCIGQVNAVVLLYCRCSAAFVLRGDKAKRYGEMF